MSDIIARGMAAKALSTSTQFKTINGQSISGDGNIILPEYEEYNVAEISFIPSVKGEVHLNLNVSTDNIMKISWGDGVYNEVAESHIIKHAYENQNYPVTLTISGGHSVEPVQFPYEPISINSGQYQLTIFEGQDVFQGRQQLKYVDYLDALHFESLATFFEGCSELRTVDMVHTDHVTNFTSMFNNCYNLRDINTLDTSGANTTETMFNNCQRLTSIKSLDVSHVSNMYAMFRGCYALREAPKLNSIVAENIIQLFAFCSVLEKVPLLNTDNVSNMTSVFNSCYALKELPIMNTNKVVIMETMCNGCTSLTLVPLLDTSKVSNMFAIFRDCRELINLPEWDVQNVTNLSQAFNGCSKLKSLLFKNINTNFDITTTGLEHDAILTVFNNLMQQVEGVTKYLTLGAEKLALLSDEEKLIAVNKGWSLS